MPTIRIIEGDEPPAVLSWDFVWGSSLGDPRLALTADWRVAGPDETNNRGGLQSLDPMGEAVITQLFSNRYRPDDIDAPDGSETRMGWHGDSFDIDEAAGEGPLGSFLWTLARAAINTDTGLKAEFYATDALQTLIRQGVAAQINATHELDPVRGRLVLRVQVIDKLGREVVVTATPAALS